MEKYFNKVALLIFLIIPFLKPVSFQYISSLNAIDTIFDIWRLISIGIIFASYIVRLKITRTMISIILLQSSILLSSIINGADLTKPITNLLTIVGFSMLVELVIRNDLNKFIKVMLIVQLFINNTISRWVNICKFIY